MNDEDLDRRLACADPATPSFSTLDATVADLLATGTKERTPALRRRAIAAGGAIVLAGSLAAATDLDAYLLSVPPFTSLSQGTVRPPNGLPYVPVGELDRGEDCRLYIDLGGLSAEEIPAVSDEWASIDPAEFERAVHNSLTSVPTTDEEQTEALIGQILAELEDVVPGIRWGSAPPGEPFAPGEPHLTTISQVCADDLASMGRHE